MDPPAGGYKLVYQLIYMKNDLRKTSQPKFYL